MTVPLEPREARWAALKSPARLVDRVAIIGLTASYVAVYRARCSRCDHGTDPETLTTCQACHGTGDVYLAEHYRRVWGGQSWRWEAEKAEDAELERAVAALFAGRPDDLTGILERIELQARSCEP